MWVTTSSKSKNETWRFDPSGKLRGVTVRGAPFCDEDHFGIIDDCVAKPAKQECPVPTAP